jgi:prolyl-tRNA synthetase
MQAQFLDETGKSQDIIMGCYGIGISRIVAACIEQNHDDKGIVFPENMAPFDFILCPFAYNKSELVRQEADKIYDMLKQHGYSVILDDRDVSFGNMMNDSELIGIPTRIVISPRLLEKEQVEIFSRQNNLVTTISIKDINNVLKK